MRDRPLVQLTLARMREFLREPGALFWVFVFPVLLAVGLGIAFRSRPEEKLQVAVVAGSPEAEATAARLGRAPGLAVHRMDRARAERALRVGRVDLTVEGLPRSARDLARPRFRLRFDPARAEGKAARLAVEDALERDLGRRSVATIEVATQRDPGGRYIDFLVPGLIGLNVMGSGMWGIGFVVVLARTRKLLRRLAVTPMRRSHYLLSFIGSRLLFLALEVAAIVLFGWLIFGVRVHGSVAALACVALLGGFAFTGLALLVAARPRSVESASGWMNFVQLPMWLVSGSFFTYERFPEVTHAFIRALPLTALNDGLRAVMNEGLPLWATWPQLAVLGLWGTASFGIALWIFRWQ